MEEKKVFCENCRAHTGYELEDCQMTGTIHGVEYSYFGKEARCKECGNLVYIPQINDENLEALYEVYRKENGIICLKDVKAIPEKYNIGKRPLSKLLGWGEQTLTRYLNGDVPSRQYSEILKHVYFEPHYYLEILEKNKNLLDSELTYKKTKNAVDALLEQKIDIDEKMENVIAYILNKCQDITPLALQKVLYYIQGFYYAFFGVFLFKEDCQAWTHGPVYKSVYFRYVDYHFDPIAQVDEFDSSVFSAQEKEVLDSVIKNFCCYSGKILEEFTHSEIPWLTTRDGLLASESSEKVIEKELIGQFFVQIKDKYRMVAPVDIHSYAAKLFSERICS